MRLPFAVIVICFGFLCANKVQAQENSNLSLSHIGIETQLYPAGAMTQVKLSFPISQKGELIGKFGYNVAKRQNFGKHDEENGGGFGGGLAYRYYLRLNHTGWFVEARASLWYLNIDWQNNNPFETGSTKITVFQPTISFGYDFVLKKDRLKLGLMAGFGYEVNMKTDGDEVGEGGISLIGVSLAFRLK